ncbi:MAG: pyridoxamine 5'-phosphate oxidase family protein [Candidatus Promineifilaceae bacterium]
MARRNPARWRALEARLGRETTIWVATVRANGRPHLTPVWYVWMEGLVYIAIESDSQKFANLQANQAVALALPDTDKVILIEGEAHAAGRALADKLGEHFFNKYEWDFRYDDTAAWQLVEITPRKILAWGDDHAADGLRVL